MFQLRHDDYGLFQGLFMGMGFWHPMSEQPEQGILPLDKDGAEWLISEMLKNHPENELYKREKFHVEPYDDDLNRRLVEASVASTR